MRFIFVKLKFILKIIFFFKIRVFKTQSRTFESDSDSSPSKKISEDLDSDSSPRDFYEFGSLVYSKRTYQDIQSILLWYIKISSIK